MVREKVVEIEDRKRCPKIDITGVLEEIKQNKEKEPIVIIMI